MERKQLMLDKLAKLQEELDLLPKLYLAFIDYPYKGECRPFVLPTNLPLNEFILNFLVDYNDCYHTYNSSLNTIDTFMGKKRSFGDIYRLCKYYYSEVSLIDVFTELVRIDKDKSNPFKYYYCNNIRKRCVASLNAGMSHYMSKNRAGDEFGITLRDLLSLLKK